MSSSTAQTNRKTLYDVVQAQNSILQWKAHILRAANQDRAKTDAEQSLRCDTILVEMDRAMKCTQMKYREKQSEWFGKRGMNWHISCVLSKREDEEQLDVTSYVHLFDSFAQDSYTVFAILITSPADGENRQPSRQQSLTAF